MARPVASSVAVPSVVVPDLNVTVSPTRSSVRPPLIVAVNVAGWPTTIVAGAAVIVNVVGTTSRWAATPFIDWTNSQRPSSLTIIASPLKGNEFGSASASGKEPTWAQVLVS